jgi:hypothetical protein
LQRYPFAPSAKDKAENPVPLSSAGIAKNPPNLHIKIIRIKTSKLNLNFPNIMVSAASLKCDASSAGIPFFRSLLLSLITLPFPSFFADGYFAPE